MKYNGFALGYKKNLAYVYIWVSKLFRVVYVGQTNNKDGVLGRALAHVSDNGTLKKRCYENGIDLDMCRDFVLLSYPLPDEKRFISFESSYRLAVEYKVQTELHFIRGNFDSPFKIISKVTYTDYASCSEIIKMAKQIVEDFKKIYDVL